MFNRKNEISQTSFTEELLHNPESTPINNESNIRRYNINAGPPTIGGTIILAVSSIFTAMIISGCTILATGHYNKKQADAHQPMYDVCILCVKMALPIFVVLGLFFNRDYVLDCVFSGSRVIGRHCSYFCNQINTIFSSLMINELEPTAETVRNASEGVEPRNYQPHRG